MIIFPQGIEVSETDVICLENDLINIEGWVQEALAGKINNCKKRMLLDWHPRLLDDPDVQSLPGTEEALVSFIVNRPEYLSRRDRNED